jgi:hypothetical protein
MNRRSFFKTLAAIAAAIFVPRVAVQAKADEQGERAKAEALGAEWLVSISPKIRTVGGIYIGRAEDDFTRASDALASQWTAPERITARIGKMEGIGLYGGGDLAECGYDGIVVRGTLRPVEFTVKSCKTGIGNFVFDAESQKAQEGAACVDQREQPDAT